MKWLDSDWIGRSALVTQTVVQCYHISRSPPCCSVIRGLTITPWSSVLLETLVVAQAYLTKKYLASYATRSLIKVLPSGQHPKPAESSPHPHILFILRFLWVLSSYLRLVLQSSLFISGFPTKIWIHFSSLPWVVHASKLHTIRYPYSTTATVLLPFYLLFQPLYSLV
jgi:hypothetical protein